MDTAARHQILDQGQIHAALILGPRSGPMPFLTQVYNTPPTRNIYLSYGTSNNQGNCSGCSFCLPAKVLGFNVLDSKTSHETSCEGSIPCFSKLTYFWAGQISRPPFSSFLSEECNSELVRGGRGRRHGHVTTQAPILGLLFLLVFVAECGENGVVFVAANKALSTIIKSIDKTNPTCHCDMLNDSHGTQGPPCYKYTSTSSFFSNQFNSIQYSSIPLNMRTQLQVTHALTRQYMVQLTAAAKATRAISAHSAAAMASATNNKNGNKEHPEQMMAGGPSIQIDSNAGKLASVREQLKK